MITTLAKRIMAFRTMLFAAVVALGFIVAPVQAGDFLPKLGNYFNEDEPGWGLDIQLADPVRFGADNLIFVIWFTYREDGTPVWYLAVGQLDGMSWSGNLDVFTYDRALLEATAESIGTVSIEWSNESDAVFSWDLDGLTQKGTITGQREVSFAQFSSGPTRVDYTGHHFNASLPGYGISLLTLGHVSVGTLYFYDGDGQAVWTQGVDTDTDLRLELDMQYFTGTDLCPACLSDDAKSGDARFDAAKGGSFGSVPLTTFFVIYQARLKENPERLDDVDLFYGLAYLVFGLNADTPLGSQPFSFASSAVALHLIPGGGAYEVVMSLTPTALSLSDDEIDDVLPLSGFEPSLGVSTGAGFPPDCTVPTVDRLEIGFEFGADDYGDILRGGNPLFFVDELNFRWNIPALTAFFKPGDETLVMLVQGGLDQGLSNAFHAFLFGGSSEMFFGDPSGFLMDEVTSSRVNGINDIPPRIFSALYSGQDDNNECATAFVD